LTRDDFDDAPGWPAQATRVVSTRVRKKRSDPRPLWLRALCPKPNGHTRLMLEQKRVRRQPEVTARLLRGAA